MTRTIFVIHGVSNRDEAAFERQVATLASRLPGLDLVPVFWGDLGGRTDYLDRVIPSGSPNDATRGTQAGPGAGPSDLEVTLLGGDALSSPAMTRSAPPGDAARIDIVAAAAFASRPSTSLPQWRAEITAAWPDLPYLRNVDDPEILQAVGATLAESRTGPAGLPTRGPIEWVRDRLRDIDRGIDLAVGSAAGKVNQLLRATLAPKFAQFAGDIIVYQGNRDKIQARVRKILQTNGGYGTAERPATFLCHSLGGVITLDLCVRPIDPLHLDGIVTFGSQWPFFELIDPRPGMTAYVGDVLTLPATAGRHWINLWEPLDPLAFVAGNVFRLDDGTSPKDRRVEFHSRSGLWTHSVYWEHARLVQATRDLMSALA